MESCVVTLANRKPRHFRIFIAEFLPLAIVVILKPLEHALEAFLHVATLVVVVILMMS